MPDKIQHIHGKACKKEQQQSAVHSLFFHRDLLTCQIQQKEEKYRDAAVNIWPVVQTDLRLHISDMAGDHIEDREIGSPRLWEIKVAGCRTLERTDLRQQNSHRESAGKQGVDSKPRTALHVFSYRSRFFQNKKCDEIKHQKQAGHDGNIVVGQNGKPKGHAVEHSLLFPHKTLQSVNDQREEENAVQPHDIPAVRRHISGQRIKNPEKSDTQNTVFTVLF